MMLNSTTIMMPLTKSLARESSSVYEDDIARRWWNLPRDTLLPLDDGAVCRLLFAGCPGSAAGPDIHDAVLYFHAPDERRVGDVEFHIRASDWYAHQHHSDARYNNVMLHVVLVCDINALIRRQDGCVIPTSSLNDVLPLFSAYLMHPQPLWPCHAAMRAMRDEERNALLRRAGLLRFEQKAHVFVERLHIAPPCGDFSAYDACLIAALAEGLGYGRDRALFRAIGDYLLGLSHNLPEPLGRAPYPAPLDTRRLFALKRLVETWRVHGAWEPLRTILCSLDNQPSIQALRSLLASLGVARADILICNAVLPFAYAVGLIENDAVLAECAQAVFENYPGLSSNRITRAMTAQLSLPHEPRSACRQQGLHYIYQQTCREKWCAHCIAGRRRL